MVQLPATAAIEYVAACCRTRTKTKTKTVRSVTDKQTNKQTNKQTDKLGLLAPRGVDPRSPNFQGTVCRGGGTVHISSKHYMVPTPFYGARAEKPPKKPILP